MTKIPSVQTHELLKRMGCQSQVHGTTVHWQLPCAKEGHELVMQERADRIQILRETISWTAERVLKNLKQQLVGLWGRNIRMWSDIRTDGSLAIVVERSPPISPSKRGEHRYESPSATGWTVSLDCSDDKLKLYFDNHFSIGPRPNHWFADATHATIKAFFGKASRLAKCLSLYEFEVEICAVLLANSKTNARLEEVVKLGDILIRPRNLELSLTWNIDSKSWTIRTQNSRSRGFVSSSKEPSLTALTARATASLTLPFDVNFIDRKNLLPELQGTGLATQTRRALSYLQGSLNSKDELENYYKSEDSYKKGTPSGVLLSAHAALAHEKGLGHEALGALAKLKEFIDLNFAEAESIHTLEVALPEFAGDLSAIWDPETALAAYNQASQVKMHPRILEKQVALARRLGLVETEVQLLESWFKIEKRSEISRQLSESLAGFYMDKGNASDALTNIESLVKSNYQPKKQWLSIVERAAESGQPVKALDLLNRMERLVVKGLHSNDDGVLVAISKSIAHIWVNVLKQPELAVTHYLTILNNSSLSTTEDLELAEIGLEEAGQSEISWKSRIARWNKANQTSRTQMGSLGQLLFKHHTETKNQVAQCLMAIDLLSLGLLPNNFVVVVKSWSSRSIPWRELLDSCLEFHVQHSLPPEICVLMGRIARDKLGDHPSATLLLSQDRSLELLDASDFDYCATYFFKKDSEACLKWIQSGLHSKRGDINSSALKFSLKNELTDDTVVDDALCQDWVSHSKSDGIAKRVSALLSADKYTQLENLTANLLRHTIDYSKGRGLVLEIINLIKAHPSPQSGAICSPLVKYMVDGSRRSNETLSQAVQILNSCGDLSSAKEFIRELIDREQDTGIDPAVIENLFQGDSDILAKIHLQNLHRSDASLKPQFARSAIRQLKRSDQWNQDMEVCFATLISLGNFLASDLDDLRQLDRTNENKNLLVGALIALGRLQQSQKGRILYLSEAATLARTVLRDPLLSYEITSEAYQDSQAPEDILKVARAAQTVGKTEHATHLCLLLLRTPECLTLGPLLLEAIEILAASKDTRLLAGTTIQTLISWAEAAKEDTLADELINFAIVHGLATKSMMIRDIGRHLAIDNLVAAEQELTKLILRSDHLKEPTEPIFDALYSDVNKNGLDNIWWNLLASFAKSKALQKISPSSRREVLFRYSMWLFSLENRRDEALRGLIDVYQQDPSDSRTWIPIYILLEDIGDEARLANHLEMIIPKLELSPTLLEQAPFSIESMKTSLKRARAKLTQKLNPTADSYRLGMNPNSLLTPSEPLQTSDQATLPTQKEVALRKENLGLFSVPAAMGGSEALQLSADPNSQLDLNADPPVEIESPKNSISDFQGSLDWRTMALSGRCPVDAVERIFHTAFASETEKHIALQVTAILCGSFELLDRWHWRVWRNPDEFGYSLNSTARLDEMSDLKGLKSGLFKFLHTLGPVLSVAARDRQNPAAFLARRGITRRRPVQEIPLDHPVLLRCGFKNFTDELQKLKFVFLDSPDFGSEIFMDVARRHIYFSKAIMGDKPPGYLLHRSRYLIFGVTSGIYPLVTGDAKKEIHPMVEYLAKLRQSSILDRFRDHFNADAQRMHKLLQRANLPKIQSELAAAGNIKLSDIKKLQNELQLHTLRVDLAGTLDLIGLFESIIGDFITTMSKDALHKHIEKSMILRDLLMFTTKLKL